MTDAVAIDADADADAVAGGETPGRNPGPEPELGLRERKRRDTRRRIVLAAVALVEERGMDGATVDEISRIADISPRTFFNYFASKEEVIAGDAPVLPDPAVVDTFVAARGRLIEDLAALLEHAADAALDDVELTRMRTGVIKQNPHLISLRMTRMRHFEEELTAVVERRLEAERSESATGPDGETHDRAALVVYAFSGVLRHAWVSWANGDGSGSIIERLRRSCRLLDETLGATAPR